MPMWRSHSPGGSALRSRANALRGHGTGDLSAFYPYVADHMRGAYLDGLSYIDLSDRYAVPLNTMRTWLRRSLLKLKECMEA